MTHGWIGAAGTLRADWSVSDNFGSDGVGQQRILVAGQVRWTGAPGVGNHGLDLALDGVPDGVQPVQIVAEGDGTDGGSASDTISVDRTAPRATDLQGSPAAPGAVALAWRATDAIERGRRLPGADQRGDGRRDLRRVAGRRRARAAPARSR